MLFLKRDECSTVLDKRLCYNKDIMIPLIISTQKPRKCVGLYWELALDFWKTVCSNVDEKLSILNI